MSPNVLQNRQRTPAKSLNGRVIMNLVAVIACPVGLVTIYLVAACLEKTAKDLGHQIKVEIQGAAGVENELSARDIAQAENVILATNKGVKTSGAVPRSQHYSSISAGRSQESP